MTRRQLALIVVVLGFDLLVAGGALIVGETVSAGIALAGGGLMVVIVALFGLNVE